MSAHGAPESKDLTRLVFELTLLSRHYLNAVVRHPEFHLDRSAYLILTRLELDAPLSLRELSEAFQLDISTINRQVAAMLKLELVERVPDPEGGIARKIKASANGLTALAADRARKQIGIGAVVAGWSEPDIARLGALIAQFNASVEQMEHNPWPRPSQP
ncbi:MarR family transcriptional regulator [Nocardia panacis]|uniref:MarR family transcriptional regulator n=1 Tax=Nocardia panacis TaxID=2340916 RepID=A0A3A4KLJ6_9NOCA|nr:MarR family transcriptional regulator [Nocardia panacis]RJO75789.1 MarR family transcriptional regulator [Nocardia panacis]